MKKDYQAINIPAWIFRAKRNSKARERYFLKRYGSLDRMQSIDRKLQAWADEWSMNDENIRTGLTK